VAPEGSKSRLAEAAGAEPSGQIPDEKIARRCGAKHISKSKCTKHISLGTLLEVEMFKKCAPLWREAHFQVNMLKAPQCRTTFEGSDVGFAWQAQGILHLAKSEQNVKVF